MKRQDVRAPRAARAARATKPHPWRAAFSWGLYLGLSTLVMVAALFQMTRVGVAQATHAALSARLASISAPAATLEPPVVARAAFLFDANSGLVLYSKNADAELPQASCTKIMTALIAVERGNLDQVMTVGADAHALVGPDSSYMGLDTGEQLSLRDLLYGLLLPSGNDAA